MKSIYKKYNVLEISNHLKSHKHSQSKGNLLMPDFTFIFFVIYHNQAISSTQNYSSFNFEITVPKNK